jgi:hypothetical protein
MRKISSNPTSWVGWVRSSKAEPWRPVVQAPTYDAAETLLALVPVSGRLEEGQVLPGGTPPMDRGAAHCEP